MKQDYKLVISHVSAYILISFFILISVCFKLNAEDSMDPLQLLTRSKEQFELVNDYTATFIRRQLVDGELIEKQEVLTKFKKPFCIYYKYITPDPGREIIFVKGKNDDKMIVHLGLPLRFLPITISKWLSPDDPRAMASNKYPITNSGIGNLIESMLQQFELAKANNELECFSFGTEYLDGRETIVIARRLPEKKDYLNYLSIINIDKETNLPIRVICINWDLTLEEYYYYKDLKINQGLTDNDFDPNNSEYKFVGITLK